MTTQFEIEVPKFLARNGPSGWYSHFWMSRADQSFTSTKPKMWLQASRTSMRVPGSLRRPTKKPTSSS